MSDVGIILQRRSDLQLPVRHTLQHEVVSLNLPLPGPLEYAIFPVWAIDDTNRLQDDLIVANNRFQLQRVIPSGQLDDIERLEVLAVPFEHEKPGRPLSLVSRVLNAFVTHLASRKAHQRPKSICGLARLGHP